MRQLPPENPYSLNTAAHFHTIGVFLIAEIKRAEFLANLRSPWWKFSMRHCWHCSILLHAYFTLPAIIRGGWTRRWKGSRGGLRFSSPSTCIWEGVTHNIGFWRLWRPLYFVEKFTTALDCSHLTMADYSKRKYFLLVFLVLREVRFPNPSTLSHLESELTSNYNSIPIYTTVSGLPWSRWSHLITANLLTC